MTRIVESGITGGYDFDELEDGRCLVRENDKVICTQPSREAMRQWINEQRRKRLAAKRDQSA